MKKSGFIFIKCAGCGQPFKAYPICRNSKKRAEYCEYCRECLTFKKGTDLLIKNLYERQAEIKNEIDRVKQFHERRMRELLGD